MDFKAILKGDFTNLKPLCSNVVRIFISSTFTDMVMERNYLMRNIYPKIRTYCQSNGLDFQVVDMRWGITDDLTDDHMTTDICLREIESCQQISNGPNFIAFIGNKYGYQPIPNQIDGREFEALFDTMTESSDKELLSKWYLKDENSVPATYNLQSITSHFPYYADMTNKKKNSDSKDQWWKEYTVMLAALRQAALKCMQESLLPEKIKDKYFTSVTEKEITRGILECDTPQLHSVCFIRNLEGISEVNDHEIKAQYIDMIANKNPDIDSINKLDTLKNVKITNILPLDCVHKFTLKCDNHKLELKDAPFSRYLIEIGERCYEHIKTLIDQLIKELSEERRKENMELYKEIQHHAMFCIAKCKIFFGRHNLINHMTQYLCKPSNTLKLKPIFTIHGKSGSGKTSLMAKIAKGCRQVLGENSICIVRFLGTSPECSDLWSLLKSICQQICLAFDLRQPKNETINDINSLVQFFGHLLLKVSEIEQKSLVLVLDSIDQLSSSQNAYSLHWLPKRIPSNVYIIVSTLPNYGGILKVLKNSCKDDTYFLEVSQLSKDNAIDILTNWFRMAGRKVKNEQKTCLLQKFENESSPLYLRLAFDEACLWKSYTIVSNHSLADTTRQIISNLFERLEKKLGITLVSHSLAYITVSKDGLSEAELEDILSLDDLVLNQVYQYWDPPVAGVVRLPPLLWKRIRAFLGTYLVEKSSGQATVLSWYHRQFWEAADARYLQNEQQIKSYCQVISEYFLGTWSEGKSKPIEMTQRGKLFNEANRQVASQPISFLEGHYNLRKLQELPIMLIKSGNEMILMKEIIFNYHWILCKIKGMSIQDVIIDFDLAIKAYNHKEVEIVRHCLLLASDELIDHPTSLAAQLIARLCSFENGRNGFKWIHILLEQARQWLYEQDTPMFIPMNSCMVPPGGALQVTFRGHVSRVYDVCISKNDTIMLSIASDKESFNVHVWNLQRRECIHVFSLPGNSEDPLICFDQNGNTAIAGNSNIAILNIKSCEVSHFIALHKGQYATSLQIQNDGNSFLVGCSDGEVRHFKMNATELNKYQTGDTAVVDVVANDNNDAIIVSHEDGSVIILELNSGEITNIREESHQPLFGKLIFYDQYFILPIGNSYEIWQKDNNKLIKKIQAHSNDILCMLSIPELFITGSKDKTIKLWNKSFQCINTLKDHDDSIWCMDYNHDNKILCSGSKDDTIKLWNTKTWKCITSLVGHSSWISCLTFNNTGQYIITGANDKNVKLWNISKIGKENEQYPILPKHNKQPTCIVMSNDGHTVISGSQYDCFKIWNYDSILPINTIMTPVTCLLLTDDNNYVIVGDHNGLISKYHIKNGKLDQSLQVGESSITSISLSNNMLLNVSNDNGFVFIVNINKLELIGSKQMHTKSIKVMISIPSTNMVQRLITGSKDTMVKVLECHKNNIICCFELKHHKQPISSLALSKNNNILVSGSQDGEICSWLLSNGTFINNIQASNDTITCLSFLSNDDYIISACHSSSNQLIMWNIQSGKTIQKYSGHQHSVVCIRITDDEKYLLSSSRDGTVKLWLIENGDLMDTIDFHSQIKFMVLSKMLENGEYHVAVTNMTGTIGLLKIIHDKLVSSNHAMKNSLRLTKKTSLQLSTNIIEPIDVTIEPCKEHDQKINQKQIRRKDGKSSGESCCCSIM